jgi:predicted enzyme related to lactoylglutathione lyase
MSIIQKHTPGTFCWLDLGTTDTGKAKHFYTILFGWEAQDVPMGDNSFYTMLNLQGQAAAALYELSPEMKARGIPARWLLYIAVESADEIAAKVPRFGGSIMGGPYDVMDVGRMVLLGDPQGAAVAAWQPKSHLGVGIIDEIGSLCWSELNTSDSLGAEKFYTSVFGWGVKTSPMGAGTYTEWLSGGKSAAGMMQILPEWGPVPPHWLAYFRVANCEETMAKAVAMGAKSLVRPMDIPKVGRFALIQDPQGAVFAVIALNPA